MFMVCLVPLFVLSPAEEAWRHQQKIRWHVELLGATVGAGYQRGPLCWPLTHGDRHEGKWAKCLSTHRLYTSTSLYLLDAPTTTPPWGFHSKFVSHLSPPFLRWLSKVFGQPFHRGFHLISVSSWGSAWTKTRPRDPSLTWSSPSWRRCKTSERLRSNLYTPVTMLLLFFFYHQTTLHFNHVSAKPL